MFFDARGQTAVTAYFTSEQLLLVYFAHNKQEKVAYLKSKHLADIVVCLRIQRILWTCEGKHRFYFALIKEKIAAYFSEKALVKSKKVGGWVKP